MVRVQYADWRGIGGGKSLPNRVCYVRTRSRRLRKDLYLAETVLHRCWLVDLNPQKLVDIYTASLAPYCNFAYSALACFRMGLASRALPAEG